MYLDTWIWQKPQAHFSNRLLSLVELRPEHYGWLMDNGPLWWHAYWSGSDWGDWSHCGHLSWMSTKKSYISYVNGLFSFCLNMYYQSPHCQHVLFYFAFCYGIIRLLWIFAVFLLKCQNCSIVAIDAWWRLHASLTLKMTMFTMPLIYLTREAPLGIKEPQRCWYLHKTYFDILHYDCEVKIVLYVFKK